LANGWVLSFAICAGNTFQGVQCGKNLYGQTTNEPKSWKMERDNGWMVDMFLFPRNRFKHSGKLCSIKVHVSLSSQFET
jgi:hypothetical protein